ncbi:primosomal replication protein N [Derxia gummosa]|uniref:Replication restart protein PriB n=1 Tax=Derxia gummosa DSM 723 TaxID=1121388 RepID=A0A8B6X7A0_9BURK|nr:primosomal replication protein N [Derxia gummosa]
MTRESTATAQAPSNTVVLAAQIVERGQVRYTPAGVPVLELRLGHASQCIEAGAPRQVAFEAAAVALGPMALRADAAPAGCTLRFEGFLAQKSLKSKTLVIHITNISAPVADT